MLEFEHARNEWPYWTWMLLDPGNECYGPWCNAAKRAVDFNGQKITVKQCKDIALQKAREWCLKATTTGSFGSRNKCKYKELQAFWIRTSKGVFNDQYCNDLSLHSILAMAKLCPSQFWSLSFFLSILTFMSYTIKTHTKKSWKLVIELDLQLCFSYEQLLLIYKWPFK